MAFGLSPIVDVVHYCRYHRVFDNGVTLVNILVDRGVDTALQVASDAMILEAVLVAQVQ
jgi:hypothetical protein